jgi:hypothetical protein
MREAASRRWADRSSVLSIVDLQADMVQIFLIMQSRFA